MDRARVERAPDILNDAVVKTSTCPVSGSTATSASWTAKTGMSTPRSSVPWRSRPSPVRSGPLNDPVPVSRARTTACARCDDRGNRGAGSGYARDFTRPFLSVNRSGGVCKHVGSGVEQLASRIGCTHRRSPQPIETVVRPPPTPTSNPPRPYRPLDDHILRARPNCSATICGSDCTIVPDPISTPAVIRVRFRRH